MGDGSLERWIASRRTPLQRGLISFGLIPLVIAAIVLTMILVWDDDSNGAEPTKPTTPTTTSQRCITETGATCQTQARRDARRFRNGKIGNSAGVHFSRHGKRLIRRWYANHPNAFARNTAIAARSGWNSDWWKFPFEQLACAPTVPGYRVNCAQGTRHQAIFTKTVTKVTVVCSGAVVIGALAGGGQVGAGRGGLACFWAALMKGLYG